MESKNLVKRVSSKIIHKGEYINLRADKLEKNGKIIANRDVVEHVGSIVAVPYEVVEGSLYFYLVKQWRNPIEDWVLEFPAGTLNENEDHEIAVIREFIGAGTFYGIEIMPLTTNGGWYLANNFFLTPASSFFIIGFTIWALRQWKTDQIEEPEFKISKNSLEQ